ncbi:dipeptidase PepV [Vagococcus zengguangii]|uniref:Dipeptidase PepV n=1 Tax=Vagococcus zengguangii TaxID=2571750 RepID=A0A4D7CS91_9ENTE|nr:dipeptidase PepV [Vagococcus zengguangii]QCI86958.1 dipeptidase PepV [Vagococcus zengguangii]TLG80999.1 dipeptidase PepV [Vagococcus zengguangii]
MTTIDWTKEVEARKEALLEDLFGLLRVPSVREDDKATADAPVGPGPKEALLHFLALGERDGFVTKNVENIAGHIEFGAGDETLGIFSHVDVVPVGTGWDTDPFEPVIKDGRIYARGSSDDKGPSMAAYYAIKMIKELELPTSKRIRLIIGTDEESSWKCVDRYLEVEETPDFGFAPDAEFPIINGEKGNVTVSLNLAGENEGAVKLISFKAGLRANMVPESGTAVLEVTDADVLASITADLEKYVTEQGISGEVTIDGSTVTVFIKGKSAHGASPHLGINGGTHLANFLNQYAFEGNAKTYINTIATFLHDDTKGEKIGVAIADDIMGELSLNVGVFKFDVTSADNSVILNMRYPKGTDEATIGQQIADSLAATDFAVEVLEGGKGPHYVPEDDELVKTLLSVYEEHTGLKGHGQVIGGGTFGRLLERGVAYGAMFPDSIDTMHQANEFMALNDLFRATAIYADAIYRLVK